MARQSLYRKYRPQTFDEVVGQDHIVRTLRNAVAEGQVAHAYLFSGPRGTGKTTTARLLAKALNCESGPTPDPDQTCDSCKEIAEGRHPDVHELDAASRTGVDAVREEIITKVNYAATRGSYRVYIIDEVHMLSASAFNALLKTLEEPPGHALFILCTTHPHKVPATIHSRCQRFDFHRIGVEEIVRQLEVVAREEEIDAEPGVLTLIGRHAAGGLRDAISTLDQLAVYTGKRIGVEDVEGLLGEVDAVLLLALVDLVADRDVSGAFRFVADRADVGTDMAEFARALVGHFRDLYVVASVGDASGIVDVSGEDMARLEDQARRLGPVRLARCLDLLSELLTEVRWSTDPRLALEVTLTRMANPRGELTLEALSERVEALEEGRVARLGPAMEPPSPPADEIVPREDSSLAPPRPVAADVEEPGEVADEDVGSSAHGASPAGTLDRAGVKRAWPAVVSAIKKSAGAPRATLFSNTEVDVDGPVLVVEFPQDREFAKDLAEGPESMQALRAALGDVLGGEVPEVRFQSGRGPVLPATASEEPEAEPGPGPEPEQSTPEEAVARSGEHSVEAMLINDLGAEVVDEDPGRRAEEGRHP